MKSKVLIKIFTGIIALLLLDRFNGLLIFEASLHSLINLLIILILTLNIINIFTDDKKRVSQLDYLLLAFLYLSGINTHDKFRFFLFLSLLFLFYLFKIISFSGEYNTAKYKILSLMSIVLSVCGAVVIKIKISKTLPLFFILSVLFLFQLIFTLTQNKMERSVEEVKEGP